MRADTLDRLVCPLSGRPLRVDVYEREGDEIVAGALTSDAATYPIVAGIPVLRPGGEEVLRLLAAGDHVAATATAAFDELPRRRLARLTGELAALPVTAGPARVVAKVLGRRRRQADVAAVAAASDWALAPVHRAYVATAGRSLDAFHYFAFRCAMPRHLVGLSCVEALLPSAGPVLDLGCGAGHLTWSMSSRPGAPNVIGVDRELFLLLAARRIAPNAEFVCADLTALPFPPATAAAAFAFDVLSFVTHKATVFREIERVLAPTGRLAVTSVKNSLVDHVFAGEPLPPAGWRSLVAHLEHRVLDDGDILARYLDGVGLPAKEEPAHTVLERARVLTILAAKGDAGFDDEPMFDEWPHARGTLAVNPLYRPVTRTPGGVRYVRSLPADTYGADNPELLEYLPDAFDIADADARRAAAGEHPDELEHAVRRLAVLALPPALAADPWPRLRTDRNHDAS